MMNKCKTSCKGCSEQCPFTKEAKHKESTTTLVLVTIFWVLVIVMTICNFI